MRNSLPCVRSSTALIWTSVRTVTIMAMASMENTGSTVMARNMATVMGMDMGRRSKCMGTEFS